MVALIGHVDGPPPIDGNTAWVMEARIRHFAVPVTPAAGDSRDGTVGGNPADGVVVIVRDDHAPIGGGGQRERPGTVLAEVGEAPEPGAVSPPVAGPQRPRAARERRNRQPWDRHVEADVPVAEAAARTETVIQGQRDRSQDSPVALGRARADADVLKVADVLPDAHFDRGRSLGLRRTHSNHNDAQQRRQHDDGQALHEPSPGCIRGTIAEAGQNFPIPLPAPIATPHLLPSIMGGWPSPRSR